MFALGEGQSVSSRRTLAATFRRGHRGLPVQPEPERLSALLQIALRILARRDREQRRGAA